MGIILFCHLRPNFSFKISHCIGFLQASDELIVFGGIKKQN